MTKTLNNTNSNTDSITTSNTAAADSQTALTPEQVLEQLRALGASIPDIAPLTPKERRQIHQIAKVAPEVLLAQIDVIGVSSSVQSAVNSTTEAAQQLVTEDARWATVEGELQALLSGVNGANLIRRQKLQLLGAQAYGIGVLLARSEENSELKPHVERVRRLKRLSRGKKSAPQAPAPQTPPAGDHPQTQAGM
jgi:hypothetical protein